MNIFVTGGASGLGATITAALASEPGYQVYFSYSRSGENARDLEKQWPNARGYFCDFTDPLSVSELIATLGVLDLQILINNACGPIHKEHFYKTDPTVFQHAFERDVMSVIRITQEAMKHFRKQKFGKIINILSSALVGNPPVGWSSYTANKAYLEHMSKCWATEGARFHITSNNIAPAMMQTNMTSDMDERLVAQAIEQHPLHRLLETKEVTEAVLFFVKASQQINGTTLVINSGESLR